MVGIRENFIVGDCIEALGYFLQASLLSSVGRAGLYVDLCIQDLSQIRKADNIFHIMWYNRTCVERGKKTTEELLPLRIRLIPFSLVFWLAPTLAVITFVW